MNNQANHSSLASQESYIRQLFFFRGKMFNFLYFLLNCIDCQSLLCPKIGLIQQYNFPAY